MWQLRSGEKYSKIQKKNLIIIKKSSLDGVLGMMTMFT
jgi:hypothetical protein